MALNNRIFTFCLIEHIIKYCILRLLIQNLTRIILHLNLIASNSRNIRISFQLFLELLKVKILEEENLICLLRVFRSKCHYFTLIIVYNYITRLSSIVHIVLELFDNCEIVVDRRQHSIRLTPKLLHFIQQFLLNKWTIIIWIIIHHTLLIQKSASILCTTLSLLLILLTSRPTRSRLTSLICIWYTTSRGTILCLLTFALLFILDLRQWRKWSFDMCWWWFLYSVWHTS